MRSYQKGRALEYALKQELEERGFFVIRSAGSHGPADLVAIKNGEILLLQVKHSPSLSMQERKALIDAARRANAKAYVVSKAPRARTWRWIKITDEGFELEHVNIYKPVL